MPPIDRQPTNRSSKFVKEQKNINNLPPIDDLNKDPINLDWQENVLSSVENPAYYLRLFMVSEDTVVKAGSRLRAEQTIQNATEFVNIAESGASAINISTFTMKTVIVPSAQNRSVAAMEANMRLYEPMGLSLYDRIVTAGSALGIRNFYKAPFFLEIKFHGYDSNGNYLDQIGPGGMTRSWFFRFIMQDIVSEFTDKGTFYDLKMIQFDDLATTDAFFRLEAPFNPQSKKVGDIAREIIEAKREEEIANYGYQRNIYDIQFLPINPIIGNLNIAGQISSLDPSEWSLVNNSTAGASNKSSTADAEAKEVNFSRGQTLENIFEQIFVNTAEGQALTRRSNNPREYGDDSEFIVIWWVVPMVDINEDEPYDWRLNDYNRKITYFIKPFVSVRGVGSPKQQVAIQKRDTEKMREKLSIRYQTQRLRKRYDYLFTGLNTEVLNIDLKLETLWKALIPLFGGNNFLELHTPGPIESETDFLARQQLLNELYSRVNQGDARIKDLTNDLNSENLVLPAGVTREEIEQELINQRRLRQRFAREREQTRIEVRDFAEERRNRLKKQFAIPGQTFIEDIPVFNTNNYIPVSIDKSSKDGNQEGRGSVEGRAPIEQSMTTAILNQLRGGNLLEINLTVRGDPYWLGFTHLERENYLAINQEQDPNLTAFNTGEYLFLLKFNIPKGDTIGEPNIVQNDAFTGLYLARYITHNFENGSFTQTISAIRDINIDITQLVL
jgi:hypothetical protein